MTAPLTKTNQLYKAKKPRFNYQAYARWIHENNKPCVVCGRYDIEVHHITDIYHHLLRNEPRRSDKRVVPLCKSHHKEGKNGIHILSKEDFYAQEMDLYDLLDHSRDLLEEYLNA